MRGDGPVERPPEPRECRETFGRIDCPRRGHGEEGERGGLREGLGPRCRRDRDAADDGEVESVGEERDRGLRHAQVASQDPPGSEQDRGRDELQRHPGERSDGLRRDESE